MINRGTGSWLEDIPGRSAEDVLQRHHLLIGAQHLISLQQSGQQRQRQEGEQ